MSWNFHFSDDGSNLLNARPLIEISGWVFSSGSQRFEREENCSKYGYQNRAHPAHLLCHFLRRVTGEKCPKTNNFLRDVQCTMYNVQCALKMCDLQWTMCDVQWKFAMCIVQRFSKDFKWVIFDIATWLACQMWCRGIYILYFEQVYDTFILQYYLHKSWLMKLRMRFRICFGVVL